MRRMPLNWAPRCPIRVYPFRVELWVTADAFKTCAQRYAEMRDTSAARALTFQGSAVLWWMCGVENTQFRDFSRFVIFPFLSW